MDAKLSNYEQWQLERFGNILPTIENMSLDEYLENGCEDVERHREWVMQREEQLQLEN